MMSILEQDMIRITIEKQTIDSQHLELDGHGQDTFMVNHLVREQHVCTKVQILNIWTHEFESLIKLFSP